MGGLRCPCDGDTCLLVCLRVFPVPCDCSKLSWGMLLEFGSYRGSGNVGSPLYPCGDDESDETCMLARMGIFSVPWYCAKVVPEETLPVYISTWGSGNLAA